jgi:uncharacterized membrane protein
MRRSDFLHGNAEAYPSAFGNVLENHYRLLFNTATPIMKYNVLSRLNINVTVVCSMFFGVFCGFFLGLARDLQFGIPITLGSIFLFAVIVVVIGFFANRTVNRKRLEKIDELRKEGVLPSPEATSDADVIRIAASGKRREAALAFWELHHKTTIEFAENALGVDCVRLTDYIGIACFVLCLGLTGFSFLHDAAAKTNLVFYLCFLVFALCTLSRVLLHRNILKNRTAVDAGAYSDTVQRFLEKQERKKASK